jgi:uncharacterized hydrophobic protein (TIGR00271 family)
MVTVLRRHLVPESQRRTLEELSSDLELRTGDESAKRSAFWTMLTLSAVIAAAGVLADSTATVIGAMIIAPLSTPIMGIALAVVKRKRNGSTLVVLAGALLVVLVGVAFAVLLPGPRDLLANSQISGRVSPGLLDLTAALATGLAGAVALARRDVAAVLPGVAIAISLVPPLAVVGVCLGEGEGLLALGALLLFLSNLVALVLAGTFVFAVLGYAAHGATGSRRSARVTLALLFLAILLPLGLNSAVAVYVEAWSARIEDVAVRWVADVPGAAIEGVDRHSARFRVLVRAPGELPPTEELLRLLEGEVPDGVGVEVQRTTGETVDLGPVG